ncbi:hypothetical protein SEA_NEARLYHEADLESS_56 [Mycobacterium phage NearlyHeadless]|nr:hypothetical protein SEA_NEARLYHEADLESS_56 [Mycobacterium phage NearlyHeadless]
MIVVKTPYGEKALDATGFDEGDGHLYVYKDGRLVGLFAKGEWERALVETPVSEPAKAPRVWDSLAQVPCDVWEVTDESGDKYFASEGHWYWHVMPEDPLTQEELVDFIVCGPFTEVLVAN